MKILKINFHEVVTGELHYGAFVQEILSFVLSVGSSTWTLCSLISTPSPLAPQAAIRYQDAWRNGFWVCDNDLQRINSQSAPYKVGCFLHVNPYPV